MKNLLTGFLLLTFIYDAAAQKDTTIRSLKEVEVSAARNTYRNNTALNITGLSSTSMEKSGALNISDGLAKLPGISQMSTGAAISKPVIRGLYGNRIQTVLSGLRFDNQQWQDEHGLGLSDFGIDHVEIIKGPASLLYGSEAVGGVINVIEEKAADEGHVIGSFNTRYLTNTFGTNSNIGIKGNLHKQVFRVRIGYESDADYSDGGNTRVVNSRFDGYYGKATYGFHFRNWTSINNYSFSRNDFGFIMADNMFAFPHDGRTSRAITGPHHTVILNVVSSQNIFRLRNSVLKFTLGYQYNNRLEDEGGGEISLDMLLSSLIYNLQWIRMLNEKTELIIGSQGILQKNVNYGKRIIVPDADMNEAGLSLFLNHRMGTLTLEAGIGSNYRTIRSFETGRLNTGDADIRPFLRAMPAVNGMLGANWKATEKFNVKICGSTGFRSGNLAELSSDGLHEGTYRYEIGNPDLRPEQNLNTEISAEYTGAQFSFSASVFNNYFTDYIYLSPTKENHLGFDVYRYLQGNADLYGGEAGVEFRPKKISGLEFQVSYSTVTGTLSDGNYLPFIPADRIHSQVQYSVKLGKKITEFYVLAGNDYVFAQTHPYVDETKTGDYTLFNAGAGFSLMLKEQLLHFSITGTNLGNLQYADHLSRFKAYGFYNIGRNIIFNLKIPFGIK